MGLGAYPDISLATARDLAGKFRALVKEGVDPIERRRADRSAQRIAFAKNLTFDECALAYIEDHEAGWRNAKHRGQWSSTLKKYASPVFGNLPVAAIDTGLVMQALKPIWPKKTETAARLRGRIKSVLDWARVHGYRSGENPARWKGNLDQCCLRGPRFGRCSTMPPYRMPRSARSWRPYVMSRRRRAGSRVHNPHGRADQ